jgi:uncharacterized protein YndB with AHSA1/START domain
MRPIVSKTVASLLPPDREARCSRVFPYPRDCVYAAFADPVALAQWWGPSGFSNAFQEFDLRPGGAWRYVMRGPDGVESVHECEFLDVAPRQRIVFRHLRAIHEYVATLEWRDDGGATQLAWTMRFESAEEFQRVRPFVEPANEQNLDRLQAHLEKVRA